MIYSKSAEYAIRAFVHLAAVPEGKFAMARQIAAQSDIPAHFLAKILQQLARHGYLKSSKGPSGGFSLIRPPETISLLDIVDAVDGIAGYKRCLGGMTECNDEAACGLHDSWKLMRSSILEYLERTSIADVAASLEQKRRALLPPPAKGRAGR
ncbi:MAG: Rrf2 family transcriptional regulator [Bryobacteraceae bacterium]